LGNELWFTKQDFTLIKPKSTTIPNYSGDLQYQSVNLKIEKPIRVKVLNNQAKPENNFPVYFELISSPPKTKRFTIHNEVVYTDTSGIAQTFVTMGSVEGEYQIMAKIKENHASNFLVFKLYARKSKWVFFLVIGVIGGLGLFLFGMNLMSEGMQRSAGDKMRSVLSTLTNNRFIAVGVGTFVTMVIQSSSATTVMMVSFVHSKLMKFKQTIGIILGSAIGTTITAQIIAFKLTDYSLLLIGLGFALQFFSKRPKYKHIGEIILGFGILFLGMYIMSESMYPLRSYEPFINTLLKLESPVIGIIIGAIFTVLIQSSSAFIGIMIILATQGLLSLEASIPLLFGANIGTSITAILASINTDREAKKVALAHTIFKIFGVFLFVWWIPHFAEFIKHISPYSLSTPEDINKLAEVLPRQIANAHTVFNVFLTLIVIPFTNLFAKLINKILPEIAEEEMPEFKTKYLDNNLIKTPALALNLAKQEVIRMSYVVQDMLNDILIPFLVNESAILKDIEQTENNINYLRDEIKTYLLKISRENISEERINEVFQIMYTIKELEQMADIISKNLIEKARNWVEKNYEFSEQGKKEIIEYHIRTQKQISRAIEVFRDVNLKKAKEMKLKYKKYRNIAIDLEKQHYERLKDEVEKSLTSSKTHLELISMLKRISGHATNIARILLKWTENSDTRKDK